MRYKKVKDKRKSKCVIPVGAFPEEFPTDNGKKRKNKEIAPPHRGAILYLSIRTLNAKM